MYGSEIPVCRADAVADQRCILEFQALENELFDSDRRQLKEYIGIFENKFLIVDKFQK